MHKLFHFWKDFQRKLEITVDGSTIWLCGLAAEHYDQSWTASSSFVLQQHWYYGDQTIKYISDWKWQKWCNDVFPVIPCPVSVFFCFCWDAVDQLPLTVWWACTLPAIFMFLLFYFQFFFFVSAHLLSTTGRLLTTPLLNNKKFSLLGFLGFFVRTEIKTDCNNCEINIHRVPNRKSHYGVPHIVFSSHISIMIIPTLSNTPQLTGWIPNRCLKHYSAFQPYFSFQNLLKIKCCWHQILKKNQWLN